MQLKTEPLKPTLSLNSIKVLPNPGGEPLAMPWRRAIAMGRAYELLREDALAHLRFVQKAIGFEYCRFHGLFHDDMAVAVRGAQGEIHYQWQQIDKVLDALQGMGLRPFIELGPMPGALASGPETIFVWKMNITPPRSWSEWAGLVEAFALHVIERYGLEEVRRWYFEVWNEPNLVGFWTGTQEEYWRLYDTAARALKAVDSQLRVGGPATAQAAWIPEFLAHCHQTETPIDFITTHSYPQDEFVLYPGGKSASKPGNFLRDAFLKIQQTVSTFAPNLEIHWTEWNPLSASPEGEVSWTDNPSVDNSYGGAFVARHCIEADDTCDSMAYWVASDVFEETGMPHAPYSSTYGLLTLHGIPKATFHALTLVKAMTGSRLGVEQEAELPPGCGLVATRALDSIKVLLWNSPRPGDPEAAAWTPILSLPNPFGRSLLITTRVSPGHGSAFETWEAMGRPHNLSPIEEQLLRAHAQPEMQVQVLQENGKFLELPLEIGINEVLSIQLRPASPGAISKRLGCPEIARWEADMGKTAIE